MQKNFFGDIRRIKKNRRNGDDVKNRFSAIDKKKRRKYGASEMNFPATFRGLKYNRRYNRWTAVVVICNIWYLCLVLWQFCTIPGRPDIVTRHPSRPRRVCVGCWVRGTQQAYGACCVLLGGFVVYMTRRVIKNRRKKSPPGRIRRSPPNLGVFFFFSATQNALFFSAIIIENRRFRRSPTEAEPATNGKILLTHVLSLSATEVKTQIVVWQWSNSSRLPH